MIKLRQHSDRALAGTIDSRILFTIRWVAMVGQSAALFFTELILGLPLPLVPALFVVSLSVLLNLWLIRRAQRHQPSDNYNLMVLGFDVLQLAALLYLTGGLMNPFSVMILAPVVVSAAVLRRQSTLVLIGLVAASVSFLLLFNIPLDWQANFAVPADYRVGVWLALVLTSCFLGGYVWWVASSARHLTGALADANLALVEEQQTRALGTLATAAAHKLGSPLNTITVIGHELARDISPDDPIYDDIQLLRAEIERCRVILSELDIVQGRRAIAEEPPLPIDRLVDEVILRHLKQDETSFSITHMDSDGPVPFVVPRPELLHALENLLQNAMQFSHSVVDIHIEWTGDHIHISITDDGPGFSADVLSRAGQPWNSARAGEGGHRGLGLFIAKSLIHSMGGLVKFSNSGQAGATVIMNVPRSALE